MASPQAVQYLAKAKAKTDAQIREIIATIEQPVEVDSINMLIGDGTNVLSTGVQGALGVDFRSRITGVVVQEFDGTTGSVVLAIAKAQAGASPSFTSIVASAPPTISSGRYVLDETLTGWTVLLERNDILRFSVTSVSSFTRLLIKLRIRRLEP